MVDVKFVTSSNLIHRNPHAWGLAVRVRTTAERAAVQRGKSGARPPAAKPNHVAAHVFICMHDGSYISACQSIVEQNHYDHVNIHFRFHAVPLLLTYAQFAE